MRGELFFWGEVVVVEKFFFVMNEIVVFGCVNYGGSWVGFFVVGFLVVFDVFDLLVVDYVVD